MKSVRMKRQILFPVKNKKNISNVVCWKFYPGCYELKDFQYFNVVHTDLFYYIS